MLSSRFVLVGFSLFGIIFSIGCSQKQLPDRPEPSYLEIREIHHRTIDLSEAEWVQFHTNMAQLALDKGGEASRRFVGVESGKSLAGLTYAQPVECLEIQETAFGLPVPCIDHVSLTVERTGSGRTTNLELYVTRHLPTTAVRHASGKARVVELDNNDNRPIEHDFAVHSMMYTKLADRLGIDQLQSGFNSPEQSLWRRERMPESRRYDGASARGVASAFAAATRELDIASHCESKVIDHSGENTDNMMFHCRVGSPGFLYMGSDGEYCQALITSTKNAGADVRLRCYQLPTVRYQPGSLVFAPVVPDWRQRLFDSIGRIIFIDAQEIPIREL